MFVYRAAPGSSTYALIATSGATAPTASTVTLGQTVPLTFGWSGLPTGNRYLGRVQYKNPSAVIGQTIIRVSTR